MVKKIKDMNAISIDEMMKITGKTILQNIKIGLYEAIVNNDNNKIINMLIDARKIFGTGQGRSEGVVKAFVMRLTHLGFDCHIIGDATTPAMTVSDCLVAVTGSGETPETRGKIEAAKKVGAKIIVITSNLLSSSAKLADLVIKIQGREQVMEKIKKGENVPSFAIRQICGENIGEIAPMGTLFEDTTQIFFDTLIVPIKEITGQTEADMKSRHS